MRRTGTTLPRSRFGAPGGGGTAPGIHVFPGIDLCLDLYIHMRCPNLDLKTGTVESQQPHEEERTSAANAANAANVAHAANAARAADAAATVTAATAAAARTPRTPRTPLTAAPRTPAVVPSAARPQQRPGGKGEEDRPASPQPGRPLHRPTSRALCARPPRRVQPQGAAVAAAPRAPSREKERRGGGGGHD